MPCLKQESSLRRAVRQRRRDGSVWSLVEAPGIVDHGDKGCGER